MCHIRTLRSNEMFYSTNLPNADPAEIARDLFPDMNEVTGKVAANYTLRTPYRLIFSSMKSDEPDDYYSNCFIAPDITLYYQASKEETQIVIHRAHLHKHDFFEFMFVLSGEIYVNIENARHLYRKGSCCILNRNVMHTEEYHTDFRIVFLQISSELMQRLNDELRLSFFSVERERPSSVMSDFIRNNTSSVTDTHRAYVDLIPLGDNKEITKTLHDYFDQITHETLDPGIGSTFMILTLLKKILLYISVSDYFSTTPVQIGSDTEYALFEEIEHTMAESTGRISRSQLANKLNYSGAYLNEICKKYSGLSLFDYGMTFCMKKAARLLESSSDNITDIGIYLGFTNRSHFYKIFKSIYGMTPAQYRKEKFSLSS